MAQNVGTVSTELTLDTRKASQQYRRFEQTVARSNRNMNGLGQITQDAKKFESALGAATNRVTSFAAAAVVFTSIQRSVSAFVTSIIDVDKALAKINVNLGQSGEGLKRFGQDLFNIARQTGQTFEVTAKAAEELARQGLGAEETTKRLKDALMLSRIAGIDSADAVETLTAAINSFNQSALTSTEVVNKFAAVDTKFAVSSRDLSEAISRVGSTAQAAGVGINELIALVTSLQQTTARGGATIGNGLKTIFTRIQAAPETISALQSVGVAIKDTNGNLRSAIAILRDYASAREKVGEAERASLDRTVAGTFQVNILKAAIGDLSREYAIYDSALGTANRATDEAIRKNEQLNQTLSSLINQTTVSIKQLFAAIGETSLAPVLRDILGGVEKLRQFLSGETGEQMGKSLGEGILKGITSVLSGPVFFGLAIVLGKAFRKITDTIRQDAQALLGLNNAAQNRAKIQERINFLLANATEAEYAQYRAATTVLAQKQAILKVQERIAALEIAGSPLTRSFVGTGALRTGKIPGFADPIASAITRESNASGLPRSQIYVDRDPRVANFANPMGLLVANKRDEPLGGFQGVNRVIMQGGDPKKGSIPGFAAFPSGSLRGPRGQFAGVAEINALFDGLKKVKPLSTEFNQIGSQIQDLSKSLNKVSESKVLSKLAKEFNNAVIVSKMVTGQSRLIPGIESRPGTADAAANTAYLQAENARMTRNQYRLAQRGILDPSYLPSSAQAAGPYQFSPQDQILRNQKAAQLREARRNRDLMNEARREQARQRLSSRTMYAGIGASFAAGFIPEGQSGTASGVGFGAAQGAAFGAGIGSLAGPKGFLAGAALGGLYGAISKLTKTNEDILATLQQASTADQESLDAANRAAQALEQIKTLREEGGSPEVIRRRQEEFSAARSRIRDPGLLAALDSGDVKKLVVALEKFSLTAEQRGASIRAFSGIGDSSRFLRKEFSRTERDEIARDLATTVGSRRVDVDVQKLFDVLGGTSTKTAIQDVSAVFQQMSEFAPALKEVDVNAGNVKGLAEILIKTFQEVNKNAKSTKQALEDAGKGMTGLGSKAFLNAPNLDVFSTAALTGRSPRATRNERGRADYAFFQELISQGAVSEEVLAGRGDYKQSKALFQEENLLESIISFLSQSGGDFQGFKTGQGYNRSAIRSRLTSIAGGGVRNSAKAQLLLDQFNRSQESIRQVGVNTAMATDPMVNAGGSGFMPGVKTTAYAGTSPGDTLKQAETVIGKLTEATNNIVVRTALSVDGTVRVVSSDVLSAQALEALSKEMTESIGKRFEAQIRDVNVRVSKLEGSPIPPSVITNGGKAVSKNAAGFYTTK